MFKNAIFHRHLHPYIFNKFNKSDVNDEFDSVITACDWISSHPLGEKEC